MATKEATKEKKARAKKPAKKAISTKTGAKKASPKSKAPKAVKPSKSLGQGKKEQKAPSDTFAVIETGGKQYQVAPEEVVMIEKLSGEYADGDKIVFEKVLLVDNGKDTQIGDPYLQGAKVEGVLEKSGRAKKIEVVRFKSKSRYLKRQGHRQPYMQVRIVAVK